MIIIAIKLLQKSITIFFNAMHVAEKSKLKCYDAKHLLPLLIRQLGDFLFDFLHFLANCCVSLLA